MPRLLRPCGHPGCPELSSGPYCTTHTPARKRDHRPGARQRGYGSEWEQIRAQVLAEEPFCRQCGAPAVEVDHVRPLRRGGTHARGNLQALCRSCHARKTARERTAG